jgi:hypothetical protein
VGTNGCPEEALAARQRQSRQAMPAAPGMPGAAPPDAGHGGEGAGDGCAGIMPTPGGPVGGAGRSSGAGPGTASRPAPVAGINRDTVRAPAADAGQRRAPGSEASGPRPRAAADADCIAARSPGTPPGDDDFDAVAAHPGQGGGRQPALPAGQQPARGALATGHRGPMPRRPVSGKDCRRPGSTTGTDPGHSWIAPSPVPKTAHGKPAVRAGKTGRSLASRPAQSVPWCSLMPMTVCPVYSNQITNPVRSPASQCSTPCAYQQQICACGDCHRLRHSMMW